MRQCYTKGGKAETPPTHPCVYRKLKPGHIGDEVRQGWDAICAYAVDYAARASCRRRFLNKSGSEGVAQHLAISPTFEGALSESGKKCFLALAKIGAALRAVNRLAKFWTPI